MSVLARAASRDLEAAWVALGTRPVYRVVRTPELGMVMVRGRAGGSGPRFNLGEMTVTRCSVELESGAMGHAYVAGVISATPSSPPSSMRSSRTDACGTHSSGA
jgi:alpha-D-ribose 1-methylphosphonate 5-triphosphate synthase subunit PhnG